MQPNNDQHNTTEVTRDCPACKQTLPHSAFYSFQRGRYGLSNYCKECTRAYARKRYQRVKDDPEYILKKNVWVQKSLYGISPKERDVMLEQQNGCCAICRMKLNDSKSTHLDHCHTTDKVRGILCRSCNHGLGQFKDNSLTLRAAAEYLEHHARTP